MIEVKNKLLPKRKSLRLPGYDYKWTGYYFVTICAQNRKCLFGKIIDGKMQLNIVGKMVDKWWLKLPDRFGNVELDIYQIMPNHLHGIVIIEDKQFVGAGLVPARNKRATTKRATTRVAPTTLGDIIGTFKSLTTNNYIRNVKAKNWARFEKHLWQRNYYEHIIRNEKDLQRIQEYIFHNPVNWDKDEDNPKNWKKNGRGDRAPTKINL